MKTKSFKSFFVEQERISVLTEDVIYMEAIVDWFSRSESILKESLLGRFQPILGALTGSSAGSRDAADMTAAAAGVGAKKLGGNVVELVDAALTFSPKTIFTGIVTILKTVQDTQEFANSARNALSLIHIKETLRKQFAQNKYDNNTINDILNYYFEIPKEALQVYRMYNSGYVLSKAVDAFKDEITKGFDLSTTKTFFKIFKQEVIKNVSELNQADKKIEIRLLDNEEKDIATKLEPKVKQALSSGGESVKKIFSNSLARSSNSSLKNMVSDLASFAARQGRNIALAGALGLGAIGALPQNAGDSAIPDAQVQQVQSQSAQENRAINAFKNRFTDASFSWGENAEQSKIIFKKIDYDQSGKVTVSGFVTIARNDRPTNKEDVRSWSELYKYRIGDAVDRALGYSFSKDMTDGPSFGEEFLFSHIKQNYKVHSAFHKTTNFKIGVNETEKLNQNPSLNSVAIPFSITVSR
jgi:hypothetical protein